MQTGTTAFGHFYSQAFSGVFRSLRKETLKLSNSVVGDVDHRDKKYRCGVSKSKDTDGAACVGRQCVLPASIFFAIGNQEFTIGHTICAVSYRYRRPSPGKWQQAECEN